MSYSTNPVIDQSRYQTYVDSEEALRSASCQNWEKEINAVFHNMGAISPTFLALPYVSYSKKMITHQSLAEEIPELVTYPDVLQELLKLVSSPDGAPLRNAMAKRYCEQWVDDLADYSI